MDLISAFVALAGPALVQVIKEVWTDKRSNPATKSIFATATESNYYETFKDTSSTLSPQQLYQIHQMEPLFLSGEFLAASPDFAEFLNELLFDYEKIVIVIAADQDSGDIYLNEFPFDGYAAYLLPGKYIFYAFIVDETLDEVVGFGYPFLT
ncbi:MAG TPA: hypothetical protein PKX20_04545, partial [Methanothrix soehngenii]|nr:hypothetical protein [Methanothrix soehngenii]